MLRNIVWWEGVENGRLDEYIRAYENELNRIHEKGINNYKDKENIIRVVNELTRNLEIACYVRDNLEQLIENDDNDLEQQAQANRTEMLDIVNNHDRLTDAQRTRLRELAIDNKRIDKLLEKSDN